jgi:hypothetical protein
VHRQAATFVDKIRNPAEWDEEMTSKGSSEAGEREVETFHRQFTVIEQALFRMQERIEELRSGQSSIEPKVAQELKL